MNLRRTAKRAGISLIGGAVIGCGLVMLVTPGPGLLVIAAGLAVLATEFVWAERILTRLRDRIEMERDRLRRRRQQRREKRGEKPDR